MDHNQSSKPKRNIALVTILLITFLVAEVVTFLGVAYIQHTPGGSVPVFFGVLLAQVFTTIAGIVVAAHVVGR